MKTFQVLVAPDSPLLPPPPPGPPGSLGRAFSAALRPKSFPKAWRSCPSSAAPGRNDLVGEAAHHR